jgi:CheY-like chemotaxis protein
MALTINGKTIETVLVIDDDEQAREGFGYVIEEMKLKPVYEAGPLHDLQKLLTQLPNRADAVVCDYHLRVRNFAHFDGDQLVASSNSNQFPALLCTTYTDSDVTVLRSKRRYIPTLLKPEAYSPETFVRGFTRCVLESKGEFDPSRRPWRTLVRVEEVDMAGGYFYVVVPIWSADDKIRIYLADVPDQMRGRVKSDQRFHAQVNIGAETADELYFFEWEDH